MENIEFTKEEKEVITGKIQLYFDEELHQEIGRFDARFLLEFFTKEVGPYFYNRGLYDAQAIVERKMEDVSEAIYELEKITEFRR
ncbi:MAG: DUF2164 domain-containing protein [Deltaproteobacteria bacterium]|nr:DUF2164 domain-containing protein [Deltaproteobacteria bacterium]